ncbi:hypothetical protein C8F01DRAFT_971956 [Mycena amicta]|nr:hypothetical protein C8F01DRAFT_971956 [Mycena amicta]
MEPSGEITGALPLWHHHGRRPDKNQINNGETQRCLRQYHGVQTVNDGLAVVERLQTIEHSPHRHCQCDPCTQDRDLRRCQNPHACAKTVEGRLSQILPKWDPRNARQVNHDDETLEEDTDEIQPFKPPPPITHLRDGFRVLTKDQRREAAPATRRRRHNPPADDGVVRAHIAATTKTPKRKATRAGAGIYIGDQHAGNRSARLPPHWSQTERIAEIAAALLVVRNAPEAAEVVITSSNPYVKDAMNRDLTKWENEGWTGVKDRELLQCLAAEMRKRTGLTSFEVVKDVVGVRRARQLAADTCRCERIANIPLLLPEGYELPGVRLADTRQRTFYRAIWERKNKKRKTRRATAARVTKVTKEILEDYDRAVQPEEIWLTARTKNMSYKTRTFFWRLLHDSFRLGRQWDNIPNWEHCGRCPTCDKEENLEHILFECDEPGQAEIWREAKCNWAKTGHEWPVNTIGAVMGCATATFKNTKGKTAKGTTRLFQILVSESAFMIWKLRNERRIEPDVDTHSKQEVLNRWYAALNSRLEIDRVLANRSSKGSLVSLNPTLVLDTWSKIITNTNILPVNWLREPRVLVGPAQQRRPNGQNR